jgi:hypothetical protein
MSSFEDRLAALTIPEPNSGCLLWLGGVTGRGYGLIWFEGKVQSVHRAVWKHRRGPIPKGLCVCHRCDVKLCAEFNHLFLGTERDNAHDCIAKGRFVFPVPSFAHGEQHGRAKLTVQDVLAIRQDGRKQNDIAATYGVDRSTISLVRRRKIWEYV